MKWTQRDINWLLTVIVSLVSAATLVIGVVYVAMHKDESYSQVVCNSLDSPGLYYAGWVRLHEADLVQASELAGAGKAEIKELPSLICRTYKVVGNQQMEVARVVTNERWWKDVAYDAPKVKSRKQHRRSLPEVESGKLTDSVTWRSGISTKPGKRNLNNNLEPSHD